MLGRNGAPMLLELRAENYAVIDHAVAGFGPGLNLLTGETGAGKSILIDALALLLGGKASSDVVRHGAERATLSCVFEATPGAEALLEANGVDPDGDEILIRREISAAGKGRVFVNNQPATVSVLRQLAPELALVHAQSETLMAFDAEQQRLLLDRFAGVSTEVAAEAYARWTAARDEVAALQSDEQERLRQTDLYGFQAKEIAEAGLNDDDEDVRLENERRVLANAERLQAAAASAQELLYEGEVSAESLLGAALRQVEELARYGDEFADAVAQLNSAKAAVEDTAATLRHFVDGVSASPERLAEIEERLVLLDRLKRKYGGTLAEVLAFGVEAERRLSDLENRDARLAELTRALETAAGAYRQAAKSLSQERAAAALRLGRAGEQQINDLAMRARLQIEVTERPLPSHWTAAGWDLVEARIATNAGEPLKALADVASGGEMSRVMLALKVAVEEGFTALRKKKTALPRTLVFDEIDIGIGGRAAEAVGAKLKALSRSQQVICITHLPQIAAFADQHFLIEKTEGRGRTKTGVRLLEHEDRRQEVARMLSGATVSATSLAHADQMLLTGSGQQAP